MTVVVRESAHGRGVFATAPIAPGDVLIRALPYALVPNDTCQRTHCTVCLAPASELCTHCRCAVLCRRCAANRGARLVHADECDALGRLAAAPASDRPRDTRSLRLLMRVLLARWRERAGAEPQYVSDEGEWWGTGDVAADEFEDVCSLTSPLDADTPLDAGGALPEGSDPGAEGGGPALALEDALFESAKQARYFLGAHARVGHELAAQLMGQLCSNSLTLYAAAGGEAGAAVSASVAMLNHSCDPTADWAVDADGCLVASAIAPIAAGAEVFISYVDPRLPSAVRRRKLRENFFFDCDCAACEAGVVAKRWAGGKRAKR